MTCVENTGQKLCFIFRNIVNKSAHFVNKTPAQKLSSLKNRQSHVVALRFCVTSHGKLDTWKYLWHNVVKLVMQPTNRTKQTYCPTVDFKETEMHRFTVTMQHVAHDCIKETMTVYAPNIDAAYGVAYRAAGQWYRIVALWSKTCKN